MSDIELTHGRCPNPLCNGIRTRPDYCPLCDIRNEEACLDCAFAAQRESDLRQKLEKANGKANDYLRLLISVALTFATILLLA